ncbi:MAG: flagellin [Hyphomicrobiaceae bacterium]
MANSINTNFAAQTALQSLNNINKNLTTTQARISTGLRVATAQDSAAYWSLATSMRADNKSLSAVSDALGIGAATIDVAYTAMNSAVEVVKEMGKLLVTARQPGIDKAKIQTEIDELQNQLRTIAKSASFGGQNWLGVDTGAGSYSAEQSIVSSFARSNGENGPEVSVGTLAIDVAGMFLLNANTDGTAGAAADSGSAGVDELGILGSARLTRADADTAGVARGSIDASGTIVIVNYDPDTAAVAEIDITNATDEDIEDYIQAVDAALTEMTAAATIMGSTKKRIDIQKDFVSSLMDALDRGISTLVDADMNAESTRLQALQVQQQLGIQALSIANSNSQNILALFR